MNAATRRLHRLLDEPKDSATIHYDEDTIPHGSCSDPVRCDCCCPCCWDAKATIVRAAIRDGAGPSTVALTRVERDHLLTLLRDSSADGSYYGSCEHYKNRAERIRLKLEPAQEPKP